MNRQLYTLGLYLLIPIILIYFLYRGFKDSRYLINFSERLGLIRNKHRPHHDIKSTEKRILIHCASVGETKAAAPLIEHIFKSKKITQLVITNTTPTGREEAKKIMSTLGVSNSSSVKMSSHYLPIDWPICCRMFLNKFNFDLIILMETELWPNFIHQSNNKNIPIVLANARMSEKSANKYQRHPKLNNDIFAGISSIAAQYESDKNQFLSLGITEQKITCVGSIKFDIQISESLKNQQRQLKKSWCNDRPCWIACSIHPGEFSTILNAHKQLMTQFPNLLLIAVPRHPEQFESIKSQSSEMQMNYINRSHAQMPDETTQLIIGDTMGELTLLCGAADIAFLGGSMINRGGHNPLEPAACGIPIIMGNSIYNFLDVSKIMIESDCLTLVNDEVELVSSISTLLNDKNRLSQQQQMTKNLFKENGQTVNKLSKLIDEYLE